MVFKMYIASATATVALALSPVASAAFVSVANFDDGTLGVASTGNTEASVNVTIVSPGLNSTTSALSAETTDTPATFERLFDINFSDISDIDPANPILRLTTSFSGTAGDYRSIRPIANTNSPTFPSTYDGASSDFSVAGDGTVVTTDVDLTTILPQLQAGLAASGTGGYASIAFIANNADNTVGTYTIDEIQYNAIPEPASLALLGVSGIALLGGRRSA